VLRRAVRRFIAGERLDEALDAVGRLNRDGLSATLDLLGEDVTTPAQAEASADAYLGIVDALRAHPVPPDLPGVDNNLSLKLTQLGLAVDVALCARLLRRVLDRAAVRPWAGGHLWPAPQAQGQRCQDGALMFVRIDMESSAHTETTLALFETLWAEGRRNVGVVIQAYLYRSATDVDRLNALGARVRLVKGAYDEPPIVAYPHKRDVDAAFARLAEALLRGGAYPAFATHDERLIDHVCQTAAAAGIPADRFEFQMLYGIRRDLQAGLRRRGYRVRVYVPFGEEWYPYFMRRLAERPANVGFVLRSLVRERRPPTLGLRR
jgi:proline dehydrogenase